MIGAPAFRRSRIFKRPMIPYLRTSCIAVLAALFALPFTGRPQSIVKVDLMDRHPGPLINPNFVGLSFEMQYVLAGTDGNHFFSPENKSLIATFQQLGIKSLRVGGNTADRATLPTPSQADVDSLFDFARAARVKVIYTLRLNSGDIAAATQMANYISRRYPGQLEYFAIGNEPNVFNKQFAPYLAEWKEYAAAITAPTNTPTARFCGPSTSPGHESWAANFANESGNHGLVSLIVQHDYPGGDARRATNSVAARDKILSPAIDEHYAKFAGNFVPAVLSNALPYRLEEANSFYDGGALDVSDTFASALWALDYQWWWASHGASGINFHTGDKVAARDENKPCRYAVFWTVPDGYNIHPIGYALKMFSLGAQGHFLTPKLENPDDVNVAVYAAANDHGELFVTLINREHGTTGRNAEFKLELNSSPRRAEVLELSAPDNNVAAKTGITLGSGEIEDDGTWQGQWHPVSNLPKNAPLEVHLSPASASIIRITGALQK